VELRAVLAELRLQARHHLGVARGLLHDAPLEIAPALLPVALVRPALDRMERRSYQPFNPSEVPQWRRQWVLWRVARRGLPKAF
jgi:phytoene synthase